MAVSVHGGRCEAKTSHDILIKNVELQILAFRIENRQVERLTWDRERERTQPTSYSTTTLACCGRKEKR